jgi:hypothetical protein
MNLFLSCYDPVTKYSIGFDDTSMVCCNGNVKNGVVC